MLYELKGNLPEKSSLSHEIYKKLRRLMDMDLGKFYTGDGVIQYI